MSARIPPGFAEAWWAFTVSGDPEPMLISLGIDLAAGEGASQANADAICNAPLAEFAACISSGYTVRGSHVIFGNDGGDIRIDAVTVNVAGGRTANALPQNCAFLCRKLTASGGRRGRGRFYMPGVAEADVGNIGDVLSGMQTVLATNLPLVLSDLVGLAQVDNVVLLHQSVPFTPNVITSLTADVRIATQRRRLRP